MVWPMPRRLHANTHWPSAVCFRQQFERNVCYVLCVLCIQTKRLLNNIIPMSCKAIIVLGCAPCRTVQRRRQHKGYICSTNVYVIFRDRGHWRGASDRICVACRAQQPALASLAAIWWRTATSVARPVVPLHSNDKRTACTGVRSSQKYTNRTISFWWRSLWFLHSLRYDTERTERRSLSAQLHGMSASRRGSAVAWLGPEATEHEWRWMTESAISACRRNSIWMDAAKRTEKTHGRAIYE